MIYEEIAKGIPEKNIHVNENMSKHISFKVGGTADFFIEVDDVPQLIYILKLAKSIAFIFTAPPTVPGIPDKNSYPFILFL